jgi:hypothetical protein
MLLPALTSSHQVTRFDPNQYRIRQAAFNYGIAEAKRIRDWAMLEEAVDIKIAEQVQFVAWWYANVSVNHGGNRAKQQVSGTRYLPYREAERLTGMKQPRLSELNARLQHPEQYRLHLLGAAYRAAMLDPKTNHRAGNANFELYTPADWIELVRKVLGEVDLDPASCEQAQETVQARTFFTQSDNGLEQDWHGRVFCNPPYTQPDLALFVDKLLEELAAKHLTAILLTFNNTDAAWFQKAAAVATAICFPRGRVRFINRDGTPWSAAQGNAFFYFGDDLPAFVRYFGSAGFIVRTI